MPTLSEEGRAHLNDIANRHGVSFGAVEHLLAALLSGQSTQAQFNHPDLGGMGQWSLGGMTMVGDMFNNTLKAKVDTLCTELSNLVRSSDFQGFNSSQSQSQSQGGHQIGMSGGGVSLFVSGGSGSANWWPGNLGVPSSVGAQNNLRYALFPTSQRLAIDIAGRVTVYDTADHQIGGFSQQQGGGQSLTFTSQYGLVRVSDLNIVSHHSERQAPAAADVEPEAPQVSWREPQEVVPEQAPAPVAMPEPWQPSMKTASNGNLEDDIFAKIERLADLHSKGILTDAEYAEKKSELLARL